MRTIHAVCYAVLISGTSIASADTRFPERLLGHWETDKALCQSGSTAKADSSGAWLDIADDEATGSSIGIGGYESGEATTCQNPRIREDGTSLFFKGSCLTEENPSETSYKIDLGVSGDVLTLQSNADFDKGQTFYRCSVPIRAAVSKTECEDFRDTKWEHIAPNGTRIVGYRPKVSSWTTGDFIFEGWESERLRWRVNAGWACGNGLGFCSVTVGMTDGKEISSSVTDIKDDGRTPFLAMAELWEKSTWIQLHDLKQPRVKAKWFGKAPPSDQSRIFLPPFMKAFGCQGSQPESGTVIVNGEVND